MPRRESYYLGDNRPRDGAPSLVKSKILYHPQATLQTTTIPNEDVGNVVEEAAMTTTMQANIGTFVVYHSHTVDPKYRGARQPKELAEKRLSSLPKHPLTERLVQAIQSTSHTPDTTKCPLCLNFFSDRYHVAVHNRARNPLVLPEVALLACGHVMCVSCLRQWLPIMPTCPMCRDEIPIPEEAGTTPATTQGAANTNAVDPTHAVAPAQRRVAPAFPLPRWWVKATRDGQDRNAARDTPANPSDGLRPLSRVAGVQRMERTLPLRRPGAFREQPHQEP